MSRKASSAGIDALARASDHDRSEALLLAATEMFVSATGHHRTEVHLYEELALNLLPEARLERRQLVATLLAPVIDAPPLVLKALLADDISVAARVIAAAPTLAEVDLLALIATGTPAHAAAIARRRELPEAVAVALALSSHAEVRQALAANTGLALPEAAQQRLVEAAADDPDLARQLAQRVDTGAAAVPFALMDLDAAGRLTLLAAAEREVVAARAIEGATRRQPPVRGDEVLAAAVAQDFTRVAALLAEELGLAPEAGHRLLADATGEALAVALRALGLDGVGITRFLIFAAPEPVRTYEHIRRLVALAESASRDAARAVLGGLDRRPARHAGLVAEGRDVRAGTATAARPGREEAAPRKSTAAN